MHPRPAGSDPPVLPVPPWRRSEVQRRLVEAMRAMMQGAIVALPGNRLEAFDTDLQRSDFNILSFARTVLGKGTPELLAVTTWARITAADGHADTSIAGWCREKGGSWHQKNFYRRLNRGLDRIADAKNEADGMSRAAA